MSKRVLGVMALSANRGAERRLAMGKRVLGVMCVALFLAAVPARADIIGPYTADANTLHLYHFDEGAGAGTVADSVSSGARMLTASGGTQGAAAFSGFGSAYDLGTVPSTNGAYDTPTAQSLWQGADGAFTYEGIIKTEIIAVINGDEQHVFTRDIDGRAFQFRVSNASGGPGELRFVKIGGGIEQFPITIPTTGDHAWAADKWFHVAVTYNGSENTADNLKLYWTVADAAVTEANEIGSLMMTADIPAATTSGTTAGNRSNNEMMRGLIDELRVSSIARGAGDFVFGQGQAPQPVPEPAGLGLIGLAALGLRRKRR